MRLSYLNRARAITIGAIICLGYLPCSLSGQSWSVGSNGALSYNGSVGIGTTTPWSTLQVVGPTIIGSGGLYNNYATLEIAPVVQSTGNYGVLMLENVGNFTGWITPDSNDLAFVAQSTGGFQFRNNVAYDADPRGGTALVTIAGSGNVGIGTTTPGAGVGMSGGLTINGTAQTMLTVQNNGTNAFALNPSSSGGWTP